MGTVSVSFSATDSNNNNNNKTKKKRSNIHTMLKSTFATTYNKYRDKFLFRHTTKVKPKCLLAFMKGSK